MFDVFQNVLFGKKKSNTESEKEKTSDSDDYVVVGHASSTGVSRDTPSQSESPLARNPYTAHLENSGTTLTQYNLLVPNKSEEKQSNIMPLQDVPFVINSALQSSSKLDQIWQTVAPCVDSFSSFRQFQYDYDFNLEKSVLSEINNK